MPEIVRDDALYCSASCKLKAQRKRKKERARQVNAESSRVWEAIEPFGNVEQLSFMFEEKKSASSAPTADAPETSGSKDIPKPPPTPKKTKDQTWLGKLVDAIAPKPPQRGKRGGFGLF